MGEIRMETVEKKERNTYMDVAKAIALLAVIMGHIWKEPEVRRVLYAFHLPMFFMVSGYFFRYTPDWKVFLKKKAKGYLIPYLSCALVITLYLTGYYDWNGDVFRGCIKLFLIQKRYTTLWFLTALFLGVLIFEVICAHTKEDEVGILVLSILLSLAGMAYGICVGGEPYWNIDVACVIQIYLAAGYLCRRHAILEKVVTKPILHWSCMLLCFLVMGLCIWVNWEVTGEYYELFHNQHCIPLVTVLGALTGSFGVWCLSYFLRNMRVLQYLGKNTMLYFAFHQSIAMVMGKDLLGQFGMGKNNYVMFLFVMCFCFLCDQIVTRTPLRFMAGK